MGSTLWDKIQYSIACHHGEFIISKKTVFAVKLLAIFILSISFFFLDFQCNIHPKVLYIAQIIFVIETYQ